MDEGIWVLYSCDRDHGPRRVVETFDDESACVYERKFMSDGHPNKLFWCEFYGSRVEFEQKYNNAPDSQLVFEFTNNN